MSSNSSSSDDNEINHANDSVNDTEKQDNKATKAKSNGAVYTKSKEVEYDETAPLKTAEDEGGAAADAKEQNNQCFKKEVAGENDVCISMANSENDFCCLTKEELEKYVKSKKWRSARIGLLIAFWVIWLALLVAAVVIIVQTPKCPERPQQVWWETSTGYQIFPRSFKDSDGDGIGDIKGLVEKLDYFENTVKSNVLYMSSMLSAGSGDNAVNNFKEVDADLGTMSQFEDLLKKMKKRGMKLVMEFPVSHASISHPWFNSSVNSEGKFGEYFVWEDGISGNPPSQPTGVSWIKNNARNKYYMSTFGAQTADLNLRNADVMEDLKDALRFWLDKGVSGFVLPNADHLVKDLTSGNPSNATFDILSAFRAVMDEAEKGWGNERCLIVQTNSEDKMRRKYAEIANLVLDISFTEVPSSCQGSTLNAQCLQKIVNNGLNGVVPAWQTANANTLRMADRGLGSMDIVPMLVSFMVRGTPMLYYGEELGMSVPGTANVPSRARSPMQWNSGVNAGFTEGAPWTPLPPNFALRSVSALQASGAPASLLSMVADLIKLRKEPSMLWGDTKTFIHRDIFIITRKAKGFDGFVMFFNLGGAHQHVSISAAADIGKNGIVMLSTPNLQHEDFKRGKSVMLDSVFVHAGSGVVAKYNE